MPYQARRKIVHDRHSSFREPGGTGQLLREESLIQESQAVVPHQRRHCEAYHCRKYSLGKVFSIIWAWEARLAWPAAYQFERWSINLTRCREAGQSWAVMVNA